MKKIVFGVLKAFLIPIILIMILVGIVFGLHEPQKDDDKKEVEEIFNENKGNNYDQKRILSKM